MLASSQIAQGEASGADAEKGTSETRLPLDAQWQAREILQATGGRLPLEDDQRVRNLAAAQGVSPKEVVRYMRGLQQSNADEGETQHPVAGDAAGSEVAAIASEYNALLAPEARSYLAADPEPNGDVAQNVDAHRTHSSGSHFNTGKSMAVLKEDASSGVWMVHTRVEASDGGSREEYKGAREDLSSAMKLLEAVVRELPRGSREAHIVNAAESKNASRRAGKRTREASGDGEEADQRHPRAKEPARQEQRRSSAGDLEGQPERGSTLIGQSVKVRRGRLEENGLIESFDPSSVSFVLLLGARQERRNFALPSTQVKVPGTPDKSKELEQAARRLVDMCDRLPFEAFSGGSPQEWREFQESLVMASGPADVAKQARWMCGKLRRDKVMKSQWRKKYEGVLGDHLNEAVTDAALNRFCKDLSQGVSQTALNSLWKEDVDASAVAGSCQ